MTPLSLPLPSAPAHRHLRSSRAIDVAIHVFGSIRDGLHMLRRYKALADKTDTELARIGLKREDILKVAAGHL